MFWAMPEDGNEGICGIRNHVPWRGLARFRNSENVKINSSTDI
jgi:hypothetical protein